MQGLQCSRYGFRQCDILAFVVLQLVAVESFLGADVQSD